MKNFVGKLLFGCLMLIVSGSFIKADDSDTFSKLYLETDRDIYVAGETLFFAVRDLLTEKNNDQTLINVVLQNEKGENATVLTGRFENYLFYSGLLLSDTLQTGFYYLSAFPFLSSGKDTLTSPGKKILIVNRFDDKINIIPGAPSKQDHVGYDSVFSEKMITDHRNTANSNIFISFDSIMDTRTRYEISVHVPESLSASSVMVSIVPENLLFASMENTKPNLFTGTLSDQKIQKHHGIVEKRHPLLSGKVRSRDGVVYDHKWVTLSARDSLPNFIYTRTDSLGGFIFLLNDYYFGKDLYLETYSPDMANIDYLFSFDERYKRKSPVNNEKPTFYPDARQYLFDLQDIVGISKHYMPVVAKKNPSPVFLYDDHMLYYKPDFTIHLRDYQPLTDLKEISTELIPTLRIRNVDSRNVFLLQDMRSDFSFFSEKGALFVDGIYMKKQEEIFSLGSEQTKSVELMNRRWAVGDISFNGIVSLVLHEEYKESIFSAMTNHFRMNDIASFALPVDPLVDEEYNSNLPDFRQLLYWNPEIMMDGNTKDISVFTGDIQERFLIRVTIIPEDGDIQTVSSAFRIEKMTRENISQ